MQHGKVGIAHQQFAVGVFERAHQTRQFSLHGLPIGIGTGGGQVNGVAVGHIRIIVQGNGNSGGIALIGDDLRLLGVHLQVVHIPLVVAIPTIHSLGADEFVIRISDLLPSQVACAGFRIGCNGHGFHKRIAISVRHRGKAVVTRLIHVRHRDGHSRVRINRGQHQAFHVSRDVSARVHQIAFGVLPGRKALCAVFGCRINVQFARRQHFFVGGLFLFYAVVGNFVGLLLHGDAPAILPALAGGNGCKHHRPDAVSVLGLDNSNIRLHVLRNGQLHIAVHSQRLTQHQRVFAFRQDDALVVPLRVNQFLRFMLCRIDGNVFPVFTPNLFHAIPQYMQGNGIEAVLIRASLGHLGPVAAKVIAGIRVEGQRLTNGHVDGVPTIVCRDNGNAPQGRAGAQGENRPTVGLFSIIWCA